MVVVVVAGDGAWFPRMQRAAAGLGRAGPRRALRSGSVVRRVVTAASSRPQLPATATRQENTKWGQKLRGLAVAEGSQPFVGGFAGRQADWR